VDTNQGKPQVVYREALSKRIEHRRDLSERTGRSAALRGVKIELIPLPRGTGNRIVDRCQNPNLTEEFMNAIKEGLEEATSTGVLMDIRSSMWKLLFWMSGSTSFIRTQWPSGWLRPWPCRNACLQADPILLEPIMKAEILLPEEFLGEVIGDLNARGAKSNRSPAKDRFRC